MQIRIGTRGSILALAQAELLIRALKEHEPDLKCETVILRTKGDRILDMPLVEFGGKGVFISELEEAVLADEVDVAVHSAKDMPNELMGGLEIVGVLKREDPRDILITRKDENFEQIEHPVIGTGSLRRQLQIAQSHRNAIFSPIRGNIDTRLKKLREGMYDGIILAAAGLKRIGMDELPEFRYRIFEPEEFIPAGGQGIIAIEGRPNAKYQELFQKISDPVTKMELELERTAFELSSAGCNEAGAVFTKISGEAIAIYMMKQVNGRVFKKIGHTDVEKRFELLESMAEQLTEG